jgi:hypothetical protein
MRKQLEYIAIFMALLVISLPFCVSSAYADQSNIIKKATVYDENDPTIIGAINAEDGKLFIEVELEQGEELQKDEIFYESDNGFLGTVNNIFDYCSGGVCVFSHPIYNMKNGKYLANIEVDTHDTNKQDSILVEFCADDVGPTVSINNVKQQINSLIITYTIEDNSVTNKECKQEIKEAGLYINTNLIDSKIFDADNIRETGAFTVSIDSIIDEDFDEQDTISIVVKAEDVLGNTGSSSEFIKSIDGSGPDILEGTLKVLDKDGKEIKYVAGSTENDDYTTEITISIDIMEKELKNIKADLKGITLNGDDGSVKAVCTDEVILEGTINHCLWENIEFDGKAEGNIIIVAEDKTGAKDKLEKTLPFSKIQGGPIIDTIFIVGHEQDNPVYVKDNFEVGVRLIDEVGFNKSKEFVITLEGVKTSSKSTDECIETVAGTWECFFRGLNPSINEKKGSISIDTYASLNDLGQKINTVDSLMTELEFFIDKDDPVLLRFSEDQTLLGVTYKENKQAVLKSTDCPTYDDSLEVYVIVKDVNKPNIIVDASDISANEIITGQCVETDESEYPFIEGTQVAGDYFLAQEAGMPIPYECSVDISNIIPATSSSPIEFTINITDPAGNTIEVIDRTKLCAYEPTAVPDCLNKISIKENKIPTIFKNTLEKTDITVLTELEYDFKGCGNDAMITAQDFECNGVEFEFFNTEQISAKKPIVSVLMTMKKQAISDEDPYAFDPVTGGESVTNEYLVKCSNKMSIMNDQLFYQELEEEEFSFIVPLEGFIMGEASDAMKKVLKQLDKDIDGEEAFSKGVEIVVQIFEFLCKAAQFAADLNSVAQVVKTIIYTVAMIWDKFPPTKAAADSLWWSTCYALDYVNAIITDYIWPAGTLPIPPRVGHLFKWVCLYIECKIADPDVWAGFATQAINLGMNSLAADAYENDKTFWTGNKDGTEKEEGWYGHDTGPEEHVTKKTEHVSVEDSIGEEGSSPKYRDVKAGESYVGNEKIVAKATQENLKDSPNLLQIDVDKDEAIIYSSNGESAVVVKPSVKNSKTVEITTYTAEKFDKASAYGGVFTEQGRGAQATKFYPPNQASLFEAGKGGEHKYMWDGKFKEDESIMLNSDQWEAWTKTDINDIKEKMDSAWLNPSYFDPFRMEVLSNVCPRAMWLNSKKREQILCAKKVCYLNAIKYGTNPSVCDVAYEVHECLYVKGALTYLIDFWDAWWRTFGKQFLYKLIFEVIIFLPITFGCYPYYTPGQSAATQYCQQPKAVGGWASVVCGLTMTGLSIYEATMTVYNWGDNDYWKWWQSFSTEANYCSQAEQLEQEVSI